MPSSTYSQTDLQEMVVSLMLIVSYLNRYKGSSTILYYSVCLHCSDIDIQEAPYRIS